MNEETKNKILKVLKYPITEAADTVKTLRWYEKDMDNFTKFAKSKNYATPNLDKWYHPTAMYDATKGNLYRGIIALGSGVLKEAGDIVKYARKGVAPLNTVRMSLDDMYSNGLGVTSSLLNPDIPVEQNNLIKNLQTPTIRAIMPEYRGKYVKKDF